MRSTVLATMFLLCAQGCLLPQNESLPPSDEGGDEPPAAGVDAGAQPPMDESDAAAPAVDDGRVKDGLQAVWKFEEGEGAIVSDVSGVGDPLNLTIGDPLSVQWLPEGGLRIAAPTILTAVVAPTKILDACTLSSEITLEAWVAPANIEQAGPARIVTYSLDTQTRNFTLAQDAIEYNARLRTTATNNNGLPATATGGETAAVAPQHVVFTRGLLGTRIYVDNVQRATGGVGGAMAEWDETHLFALANEITEDRPWLGDLHLVAVYCRELSAAEIEQNYQAGQLQPAE